MHENMLHPLTWIQMRILNRLNNELGPSSFRYVRLNLIPEQKIVVTNTMFDMHKSGLIRIYGDPQVVEITPQGRQVLFHALTDKGC